MAKKTNSIFGDFFKGLGKSELMSNGFDALVGCDIHSVPGKVSGSLVMVKASGTTVDEYCKVKAILPNGDSFWFSSTSGKVWKRTQAGVWSLVHTHTIGAVLGAQYFNGYLYYANATKLGRIASANASSEASWSSQNDSWGSFTNADTSYHPMIEVGLSLFIGDGKYVAAVDTAGSFQANSLDLQAQHRITALRAQGIYLLIGTLAGNYFNKSGVFLWDTYSASWTSEGYVREPGIDMFIETDDFVGCIAGTVGNIYSLEFSGANIYLKVYRQLRDGNETITTGVFPDGSSNLNGLPLIANSRGIYSLGRKESDFPIALNIEYVPSEGQGIDVGALAVIGTQVLMAWKKVDGQTTTYGVDKLGTINYAAELTTPKAIGNYQKVVVNYETLGTSIGIETSVDGDAFTSQTAITDTIRKTITFDGGLGQVNSLKARLTLTGSTILSIYFI